MKRRILIWGGGLILLAGVAGFAFVNYMQLYASAPVFAPGGIAIQGHDPVAYFNQATPVQGSAQFSHEWNGAVWHFANAENLAAFQAEPERYAPQFGGYCAYAVANGYTARTSPEAWHIEDGKLYLNFDAATRDEWRATRAKLIPEAQANWPRVIQD